MTGIDPGLNFFGHRVDADMTLEDLEQFLTVVDEFLRKTDVGWTLSGRAFRYAELRR